MPIMENTLYGFLKVKVGIKETIYRGRYERNRCKTYCAEWADHPHTAQYASTLLRPTPDFGPGRASLFRKFAPLR